MNETERIQLLPPGRRSGDRSPGRRYETHDAGGDPGRAPSTRRRRRNAPPRWAGRAPAAGCRRTPRGHDERARRALLVPVRARPPADPRRLDGYGVDGGRDPGRRLAGRVRRERRLRRAGRHRRPARLYLECRGTGGPTVVLVAGYRASGRYWTDDLLQPDAPRTMVLPAPGRHHAGVRLRPAGHLRAGRRGRAPQPQRPRGPAADRRRTPWPSCTPCSGPPASPAPTSSAPTRWAA